MMAGPGVGDRLNYDFQDEQLIYSGDESADCDTPSPRSLGVTDGFQTYLNSLSCGENPSSYDHGNLDIHGDYQPFQALLQALGSVSVNSNVTEIEENQTEAVPTSVPQCQDKLLLPDPPLIDETMNSKGSLEQGSSGASGRTIMPLPSLIEAPNEDDSEMSSFLPSSASSSSSTADEAADESISTEEVTHMVSAAEANRCADHIVMPQPNQGNGNGVEMEVEITDEEQSQNSVETLSVTMEPASSNQALVDLGRLHDLRKKKARQKQRLLRLITDENYSAAMKVLPTLDELSDQVEVMTEYQKDIQLEKSIEKFVEKKTQLKRKGAVKEGDEVVPRKSPRTNQQIGAYARLF